VRTTYLLIFFIILTGNNQASFAGEHYGCLKLMQSIAIDETAAKLLPLDCQDFRKFYLKELFQLSQDPKKFSHDLTKKISTHQNFDPPYQALLISTFPKRISEELKSAIHQRAKLESSKKFKYKFAVAAEERINNGRCSSLFASAEYEEICRGKDIVFLRIEKLKATANGVIK